MKKSNNIILSTVILAAISSCSGHKDEWTDGKDATGHTRDTAIYRDGGYHYYRYYGGGWFLLRRNNMININEYAPASSEEISSHSFAPRAASGGIRSGGFGESAHGGHGGTGE